MTVPRKEVISETEDGVYHLHSRCVRRAFLCGQDKLTGNDYSHRKAWIQDRIEFLLSVFCLNLFSHAVMSNHLHLILRTLYLQRDELSDIEVARRWLQLYPKRRNSDYTPCAPTDRELRVLISNKQYIKKLRMRLGSISWFMKLVWFL